VSDRRHHAYLSIGSNIRPEFHLPKAIDLLKNYGEVKAVSSAWESHAIGSAGPNFLNACALFAVDLEPYDLKELIIRPIEAQLGRRRNADKNAPRTIDLDVVLFDHRPLNLDYWEYPFVVVPLAELIPDFIHPNRREKLAQVAGQLQDQTWIVRREGIITVSL